VWDERGRKARRPACGVYDRAACGEAGETKRSQRRNYSRAPMKKKNHPFTRMTTSLPHRTSRPERLVKLYRRVYTRSGSLLEVVLIRFESNIGNINHE
jgi:hypothetical protein